MECFPGRMLEELDGMDWGRFLRAKGVAAINNIEAQRLLVTTGKLDGSKLPAGLWEQIKAHDELMSRRQLPA